MALNKSGMFFTLLVLTIITLFFVSYTLYADIQEQKSTRKRVETMNTFLFSLEKDLERQLYISGFRIIFIFEDRIIQTGQYITSPQPLAQELFFTGALYSSQQELMLGATFSDIQNNIQEKAQNINVNISLSSPYLTISQEDPWHVKFSLTAQLDMKDENNLASWSKNHTIIAFVPVTNFEDPVYFVSTQGAITNKINKTAYHPFVHGTNIANLSQHAENSLYTESQSAPTFLDRLQGVANSSAYGIESIVNLPELSSHGVSVDDKVVVDYIYFSTQNPAKCIIEGMPSWFKLPASHLSLYQVENLSSC